MLKSNNGRSVNFAQAVNRLKQVLDVSSSSTKSNKAGCFNFKAANHWAKHCPKRVKTGKRGTWLPRAKGFKGKPNMGNNRNQKSIPLPKEGETEVRNYQGTKYCFHKKCSSQNLSHTTNMHKTKEELSTSDFDSLDRVIVPVCHFFLW